MGKVMACRKLTASIAAVALLSTSACVHATERNSAENHAAAGIQAGQNFPGLVDLCDLDAPLIVAGERAPGSAASRPERPGQAALPPLEPMQVFDNLYFVGNRQVSAWVLGTPQGYFLIDAMNTENQARTIVEAGMLSLGIDPNAIEYLLVTHAHGDHYGGQNHFTTTYGPRVAMSDADWSVLEDPAQRIENPRWGPRPTRDVVVEDGETLSIPGTSIRIFVTPGHTPGTISLIFTVYDNGEPHTAALWGGTGFNFGPDEARLRQYADSAMRFGNISAAEGVDVFLSNHPNRDSGIEKMELLAQRGPGDANAFVMGESALSAFTVFRECALAQAERVKSNGN